MAHAAWQYPEHPCTAALLAAVAGVLLRVVVVVVVRFNRELTAFHAAECTARKTECNCMLCM
jgi:hypothetical protein